MSKKIKYHSKEVIARAKRIKKLRRLKKPLYHRLFHSINGCVKCQ